MRMWRYNFAP